MQEGIRPSYDTRLHCLNNNSYVSVNYIYVGGTGGVIRSVGKVDAGSSAHHVYREV